VGELRKFFHLAAVTVNNDMQISSQSEKMNIQLQISSNSTHLAMLLGLQTLCKDFNEDEHV
jgi:hypothetical protein